MDNKMTNPFEVLGEQLNRLETLLVELLQVCQRDSHAVILQEESTGGIMLAMKITHLKKRTIYNLVNKRMIPHSKKGKRLYFDEKELREWIKSGKRMTLEEVDNKFFPYK
jgi:predicted DNA-binding transcriptional regulator AlpA